MEDDKNPFSRYQDIIGTGLAKPDAVPLFRGHSGMGYEDLDPPPIPRIVDYSSSRQHNRFPSTVPGDWPTVVDQAPVRAVRTGPHTKSRERPSSFKAAMGAFIKDHTKEVTFGLIIVFFSLIAAYYISKHRKQKPDDKVEATREDGDDNGTTPPTRDAAVVSASAATPFPNHAMGGSPTNRTVYDDRTWSEEDDADVNGGGQENFLPIARQHLLHEADGI
jgi:hypothetical protein